MAINKKRFRAILISCIVVASIPICATASDSKPSGIAILPFTINSEKDLTFLQNGIFDMLSLRLSSDGRLVPIGRDETEAALKNVSGLPGAKVARKVGIETGADYAVFGSLTVFGDSASIDAGVINVETEKTVLTFMEQIRELGNVIPKIGQFASAIPGAIFGDDTPATPTPSPVTKKAPEKKEAKSPVVEKVAEKEDRKFTAVDMKSRDQSEDIWKMSWKSREMKTMINGIASGDVDNDGKNEVVLIVPDEVWIFRFEGKKYEKIKVVRPNDLSLIAVDVADINGNGFPEIFVTALTYGRDDVKSFVLEWNGSDFSSIVKNSPYYYRVIDIPGSGPVLAAQRDEEEKGPFFGDMLEMSWRDSGYVPGKTFFPGDQFNVLGFVSGNALNDGRTVAAAFTHSDQIEITDPANASIWKSAKKYGGNSQYYIVPGDIRDEMDHQYLPVRLMIRDIDQDGGNEIVTIHNDEYLGRHLEAYRRFTDAQIVSLSADGSIVTEGWKTEQLPGRITDFVIADFDNDGKEELGAAIITKEKSIFGKDAVSVIVVYE